MREGARVSRSNAEAECNPTRGNRNVCSRENVSGVPAKKGEIGLSTMFPHLRKGAPRDTKGFLCVSYIVWFPVTFAFAGRKQRVERITVDPSAAGPAGGPVWDVARPYEAASPPWIPCGRPVSDLLTKRPKLPGQAIGCAPERCSTPFVHRRGYGGTGPPPPGCQASGSLARL